MNIDAPEQVIGVHFGNPMVCRLPEFFPEGNFIAMVLLWRTLELALLGDGLTKDGCCSIDGAELNDSVFIALVTDHVTAAETLKRELGLARSLDMCQIGVSEADGWRCVYPSPKIRLNWLMDGDRIAPAVERFKEVNGRRLNLLRELLRQLQSGQGGRQ